MDKGSKARVKKEEAKIVALRNAITKGIESGIAKEFKPQKHLAFLKAGKRKDS